MSPSKNPLVLIPARGNSKRLHQKNKKLLGGKPLLSWTIGEVQKAALFENIVVSSEDEEILELADSMKTRTHRRPPYYSGDEVTVAELAVHLLENFENNGEVFDVVYVLLPTSPFRSAESITRAWQQFTQHAASSLMSVAAMSHPPQWCFTIEGEHLSPLDVEGYNSIRQNLPISYRPDGGHMIATSDVLKQYKSFYGHETLAFKSPERESLDIDTEEDWLRAEFLLAKMRQV